MKSLQCWSTYKMSNIDWDFVSVIIDLIEYLVVVIFGVITFLFFKVKCLKIIKIEDNGGVDVIIQNISKNTIFIKDLCIIVKNKELNTARIIPSKEFAHDLPDDLSPKGYYKMSIDFSVLNIHQGDSAKIKIDIYNHYTFKRRVK